jgi:hypothetical protein
MTSCKPIADSQQVNSKIGTPVAKQDVIIAEDNGESLIKLDMQKYDIYHLLKSLGMEIILDENNGNAGSSIYTEELSLFFNQDKQLKEVYINADNGTFRTSKGLQFGDDLNKIFELYGEQYVTHDEPDVTVYEYKIEKLFFSIGANSHNKVSGWGISRESAFYK